MVHPESGQERATHSLESKEATLGRYSVISICRWANAYHGLSDVTPVFGMQSPQYIDRESLVCAAMALFERDLILDA